MIWQSRTDLELELKNLLEFAIFLHLRNVQFFLSSHVSICFLKICTDLSFFQDQEEKLCVSRKNRLHLTNLGAKFVSLLSYSVYLLFSVCTL